MMQYHKVRALPFFQKFPAWRAFNEWKAGIRARRWHRCTAVLTDELFALQPTLSTALKVHLQAQSNLLNGETLPRCMVGCFSSTAVSVCCSHNSAVMDWVRVANRQSSVVDMQLGSCLHPWMIVLLLLLDAVELAEPVIACICSVLWFVFVLCRI